MSETIESILVGRELIQGVDVIRCFAAMRGKGIRPKTLISWRTLKNPIPHILQGKQIWYHWPDVWEWYLVEFAGKPIKHPRAA